MSIAAINEQLLRAVGVGVALFDKDDLSIQFCNDVFSDWFECDDVNLGELFPELDIEAMRSCVGADGRYANEIRFKKKRRNMIIAQVVTRADIGDETVYVMECQNITRIRELEAMIESYSTMVERHTRDLQREKEQVEKLLLNIMPRAAYDEYKNFGVVEPKRYDAVSVLTLSFVNFAENLEALAPATFVSELNELYTAFDQIGDQFGCDRIKTIGDTYLCIAGMHDPSSNHAEAVANAALRFLRYLNRRNDNAETRWLCRIGIGTGAVIGSVVGVQKYVYDVFGPAVTMAAAAQLAADEMQALVAPDTILALSEAVDLDEVGAAATAAGYQALSVL